MSISHIDQSGVSSLKEDDYRNHVSRNYFQGDVGARDVEALRFSSLVRYTPSKESLVTVTPFYRNNESNMMPSWMVTYDPNFRETKFESFGLLTKWRQHLTERSFFITGIDIDHTPSRYKEYDVTLDNIAVGNETLYRNFEKNGDVHYDYDATQTSVSPYIHLEHKTNNNIILSAGLRYDVFNVDYDNNLTEQFDASHQAPESQKIDYSHLSPKAGIVYQINNLNQVYANYRHAFRAPSVSTLFRAGRNTNTTDLKPVKTDSIEVGYRGYALGNISYEVAMYYMEKTDDIVSVINSDNDRVSLNAGKTIHKGIELGVQADITQTLNINTSFSYSEQTYGKFEYLYNCFDCTPPIFNQIVNFDGNDVGKAPKTLGNIALRYEPIELIGFMIELELEHLGKYYTDETNTNEYKGHDLLNLRSRYQVNSQFEIYGRLQNLTDERYSTYTSNRVRNDNIEYRPGLPLTLYAGLRYQF